MMKSDKPLRSRERVLKYLREKLDNGTETRLPPTRQLARELEVSTATVYHALREMAAEGRIETRVGSGSYLVRSNKSKRVTLALGASYKYHLEKTWGELLVHGVMQGAGEYEGRVQLLPLGQNIQDSQEIVSVLQNECEMVDGAILFPMVLSESLRLKVVKFYQDRGKPCFSINPLGINVTRNFVSPDYYGGTRQLAGNLLKKCGRKQLAYVFPPWDERLATSGLRLAGLRAGLCDAGRPGGELREIAVDGLTEEEGYKAIQNWWKNQKAHPDAIYCFGDFLAIGVALGLKDLGVSIPEEVSIIGGSGLDLRTTAYPNLTSLQPGFDQIGHEAVQLLMQLIQIQHIITPGKFLPMKIIGGETTRTEENTILMPEILH